jgi:glycosyl transferase family 25
MWEFLDKAIYINLEERNDRRLYMENMTKTFGDKVIRFNAVVQRDNGTIGCVKSHIKVLEMALEEAWSTIMILEDDAEWNKFEQGYNKLQVLIKNPYDVILLGGSAVTWDQTTLKMSQANTTTAYIVTKKYIPILLENFKEGLKLFEETGDSTLYALDVYWNKLIQKDNWFVIIPNLVYQRPSPKHFSQPIDGNVDYTNLFLLDFIPYPFARNSWPYLIDHGTEEQKQEILGMNVAKPVKKLLWNRR